MIARPSSSLSHPVAVGLLFGVLASGAVAVGVLVSGCGPAFDGATNLLCAPCSDDSQCAGNACFQDVSGNRFCGRPCAAGCAAGSSCRSVIGTTQKVFQSCFPDTEACAVPTVGGSGDAGVPGGGGDASVPAPDFGPPHGGDMGGIPTGGPVGPTGGTVDRLFFGFTGDTRPDYCYDPVQHPYPKMVINNIFTGMKDKGVQFALDQGDHMFSCGSGTTAAEQMGYYIQAANLLGKTTFMTMGNHECTGESQALCTLGSYGNNGNYTAFMDALRPIADKPYYRFDVKTNSGLAVFLVVADDVWDAAEQQWLTTQLTDADANAKYTFVTKHHPDGNTDHPEFQTIYNLVRQHKYTLFLTGHSHLYKRQFSDPRALVIGCGGAPLAGGTFFGFGTALQGTDDRIYVSVYDQATGNVTDQFDVAPQ